VPRLRNCQPVQPWHGHSDPEWVPVQIVQCARIRTNHGKQGAVFKYQILAGRPAGVIMQQFWTTKFCHVFARDMGFTPWADSKYPFLDVRQMADLRLYVRMLPGTPEPGFDKLAFPPSVVKWNKVLIHRRWRLEFDCPRNYTADQYCHTCPAGRDQCPAAVHPRSYVPKMCPVCKKRAWFDNGDRCVDCTEQETLTWNPLRR
jgi:hypothetical protein